MLSKRGGWGARPPRWGKRGGGGGGEPPHVEQAGVWGAEPPIDKKTLAMGALLGVATLVRPQSLVLAPIFALLATPGSWKKRLSRMAIATAVALLVCAPWT